VHCDIPQTHCPGLCFCVTVHNNVIDTVASLQGKHCSSHFLLLFQNVTANHRANDVIAAEDGPQVLVGRFMYGPLDMVALTGEKVKSE